MLVALVDNGFAGLLTLESPNKPSAAVLVVLCLPFRLPTNFLQSIAKCSLPRVGSLGRVKRCGSIPMVLLPLSLQSEALDLGALLHVLTRSDS
jgi:hypothetical protein